MVLSAALDKGLVFLSLVAILTSVVGGIYYLGIIKEIFFTKPDYKVNTLLENLTLKGNILDSNRNVKGVNFKYNQIAISSPIALVISTITLILLSFIFVNREWLSMTTILVQILFNC